MTEPQPPWIQQAPPAGSWRSIFKWGEPGQFKHPNPRLVRLMKETFGLTDADLEAPRRASASPVRDCTSPARATARPMTSRA